jgi:hypothetical protein
MISVLPGPPTAKGQSDSQRDAQHVALWAAISVPKAIFNEVEVVKLQMSFVVVNDGDLTGAPKIGNSHLSINGVEPADWNFVINNGLRSPDFDALPPGQVLSFGYLLGDRYFAKPGVYTVSWWGENFKAERITFRVLPNR